MTGLFPARKNILEHETQSSALTFFSFLEINLECSKTVLSTLNHCLLCSDNCHKCHFSLLCINTDFEHVYQPIRLGESCYELSKSQFLPMFGKSIIRIFAKHGNDSHYIYNMLSKRIPTNFKVN